MNKQKKGKGELERMSKIKKMEKKCCLNRYNPRRLRLENILQGLLEEIVIAKKSRCNHTHIFMHLDAKQKGGLFCH